MEKSRVVLTQVLNRHRLDLAIQKQANTIVCREVDLDVNIPDNIQLINAELFRVEGSWLVYEYNNRIVNALLEKHRNYFSINGIELKPALSKILYWTNHKTGALYKAFETIPDPKEIVYGLSYFNGSRWKELIKLYKTLFRNNLQWLKGSSKVTAMKGKARVGILINNEFELNFYSNIIKRLENRDYIIFHYGNIDFDSNEYVNKNTTLFNLSEVKSYVYQPPVLPFGMNTEELAAFNIIQSEWQNIANEIAAYRAIKDSGIKKLLINVGENLPMRNLMKSVFEGEIVVYNTMNGMKSGEAQDSDVNFDRWFVWDQWMKDLMIQKCHLPSDMFLVSGHLSEDYIHNVIYSNTIGIDPDSLNSKKVISIFSVRGKRQDKLDAFKVLYLFAQKYPDSLILVKPHPLEDPKDYILPPGHLKNVMFIKEELKNSKPALFDQLIISDLCIVFGSTVALESYWMGVPCITYEYRHQSLLYHAGNIGVKHILTEEQLYDVLSGTAKKQAVQYSSKRIVADIIVNELLSV